MSDSSPPVEHHRQCWRDGHRLSVESFLQEFLPPGLRDDDLLDLIYNEVVLREENGESPEVDEYLRRFPNLAQTSAPSSRCTGPSSPETRSPSISRAPRSSSSPRARATRPETARSGINTSLARQPHAPRSNARQFQGRGLLVVNRFGQFSRATTSRSCWAAAGWARSSAAYDRDAGEQLPSR